VDVAIDFNDQMRVRTIEIHNEAINRVLSTEFETC
jgi:hypothetical protein